MQAPKRPFYLLVALVVAWLFGVGGCTQGTYIIGSYWSPVPDIAEIAGRAHGDDDKKALADATTRCFAATDAAKPRVFPLGVASLVLGIAVVLFAARSLAGKNSARVFLVQLMLAQGLFVVVRDLATREIGAACFDVERLVLKLDLQNKKADTTVVDRLTPALRDKAALGATAARTAGAALIVLALMRRRTRDYFDAAERAQTERDRA